MHGTLTPDMMPCNSIAAGDTCSCKRDAEILTALRAVRMLWHDDGGLVLPKLTAGKEAHKSLGALPRVA